MFKEYNFEKHMGALEVQWAKIVSLMTLLLDTNREESLINVCNDPEKYIKQKLAKQPLKVPIDKILPDRSVRIIDQSRLIDLPELYHTLSTPHDMQKRSLLNDRQILLSPMELFTFFFFRSMSSLNESV
jgi:hypothetical protein